MSYNEELQSNNDALRGILDEVNALPEGTGGVQADYGQNDPAARDYIKNRPFYDSREWVPVHTEAETSPEGGTPSGQDYSTFAATSPNIFELYPVGTTVKCVIDGVEYVSTIRESSRIGNYGLVSAGDNTGEPFCLFGTGATIGVCVKDKPAGAYKVSVYALEGELKKIGSQFLPDPVQPDWNQSDPAAPGYIKNRPVREAERNGIIERELDGGAALNDPEFVALLYENRQKSTYIVDGAEYFFGEDMVFDDTMWSYTIRNESLALTRFVFATASGDTGIDTVKVITSGGDAVSASIGVPGKVTVLEIDPKYLPCMEPYVIDAEAYTYGDDALAAILAGRQIYVKVPSQNPGGLYANFMPVIQYQLPQSGNDYLTLLYLKDGIAQNIMAALQTGSFDAVYGQIVMLLSQSYDDCPLKVSPIK